MMRHVLLGKIHHARVTECHPDYTGSITIDEDIIDAAGFCVNEKVLIADCENGNRFETYIIPGERGSGVIGLNGAAAQLVGLTHRLIIIGWCLCDAEEMQRHRPKVVVCDESNRIEREFEYDAGTLADG